MFLVTASQLVLSASAQDPADTAFWNSVFSENHVLDVRIEVTREGWDAMQPPRGRGKGDGQRYTYTFQEGPCPVSQVVGYPPFCHYPIKGGEKRSFCRSLPPRFAVH